jgi:membrane-associated protease RseP (regulator of RpoE activity)
MRRTPGYRVHKSKNLAYVLLGGRMHYLGRAHSPESWERYHAALASYLAGEKPEPRTNARRALAAFTVGELAERWYLAMRDQFGPTHQKAYEARHAALELTRTHATATVGEFEPERPSRRTQAEPSGAAPVKSALGITASDLTEGQKRELKVKGGVRVDAVEGAAARAGLREGDVILSVDNTEVTDLRQFATLAAKVEKARAVSVLVRRGEWVNYLVIRPNR